MDTCHVNKMFVNHQLPCTYSLTAPLSPVFAGDPVVLGVNEDWAEDDMDYTPYTNIISAVWPKLRLEQTKFIINNHFSTFKLNQ